MKYNLNITHLYPVTMSTYGDKGNILALKKRALWRGIDVNIMSSEIGESMPEADIYFFGGGQDQEQFKVAKDLEEFKTNLLRKEVEKGKPMLLICGGYQLMGKYYLTSDSIRINGAGILDVYTVAGSKRMIGNTVLSLNENIFKEQITIAGFENHSGRTYLGKDIPCLGRVIRGGGNNGEDGTEGAVYKNVLGCYEHGPLLPKNPYLADFIIKKALEVKYQKEISLKKIDDDLEEKAREYILKRIK